ncbi:hypothetical protein [Nocardia concava]|uniref:hypothetical protein n=1 Tax=Nocardia concava TaxID=257281 RepID=UPI00030C35A2|nr:hypothetical protein [Nocardia concava]
MDRDEEYHAQMLEMSQWWTSKLGTLLSDLRGRLIIHRAHRDDDDPMIYFDKLYQAGEYELVADALAAALVKQQVPITTAERATVREILYKTDNPHPIYHRYLTDRDNVMTSLNVVADMPDGQWQQLLNQLALLPPEDVHDWLRAQRASFPESNWLGLAEVAGQQAIGSTDDAALDWARIAIAVRQLIAENTDDNSYRHSQIRSAMHLRVAMINLFGPDNGDPILDTASIYQWFLARHRDQLARAATDSVHWQDLPTERILELRQIKNDLNVLRSLGDSSDPEASEIHGWTEIWSQLP